MDQFTVSTGTVEAIEIEPYTGDVWNLETEDEEYVVSGVVVHNCPHVWSFRPAEKLDKESCQLLWMGT